MHIIQTILLSLLLSSLFIGCGGESSTPSAKKEIVTQTPKETIKDADNIFTAGDDQHVLAGEEVVIQSSILDKNKTFTSIVWSENGKILGHEEVLHANNLSVGVHEITLQMKDSDGKIYTDIIVVTINADNEGNQQPIADDFTITLDEDADIMTHLRGGDADGDALRYLFSSQPTHGTLSGSTAHLVYTPDSNYHGKDSFTFKTYDGQVDSRIATVFIVVKPVNDAPVFQTIPIDKRLKIGENLSLDIDVSDVDGDDLAFLVTPSWIGFNDGKLDISPTKDNIGKHHVKLEADDNHGGKASFEFELEILKGIRIKPIEALFISEDATNYVGAFHLVDEEKIEESITYTTYNYPKGFHHGQGNGFSLDLAYYQSLKKDENVTFTIGVSADVGGVKDYIDFNLTIIGKNDTPKFGAHKFPVATEDTLYDIDLIDVFKITDAETNSTDLNITVKYLPSWLHLTDGRLIGTPTNDDVSSKMLIVIVDDKDGFPSTLGTSLVVENINDAPIAIIHKDKNITNQYETITFDANQSYDVDKEDTIKSYLWLVDNNQTYTSKSFTTSFKTVGEHKIELTVEDENNASNTSTTTITVNPVTPMFTLKNIVLSENNSTSEIIIESQNTDLIYAAINQPQPMWFDLTSTGLFTLTTNDDKYQSYQEGKQYTSIITVRGTDKYSDMSKDENFTVTIIGKNDAPQGNSDVGSTQKNIPITLDVLANDKDIDKDTLSINSVATPQYGTAIISNGKIIYTPKSNFVGEDTFSYNPYDGYIEGNSTKVTITVKDNLPPVAKAGIDIVATENDTITLYASNSLDTDGNITAYNWLEGTSSLATTVSLTKNNFSVGTHVLTLQVQDNDGEISTDKVVVTIKANTSYTPHTISTAIKDSQWLEMADVDNDGDLDILSAARDVGASNIAWYENSGDFSSFIEHVIVENDNHDFKHISAKDLNGDGLLDIVYASHDNAKSIMICNNEGNKTFTCQDTLTSSTEVDFLDIIDVDNDGKLDIVSSSWNIHRIDWYKNEGNNSFSTSHIIEIDDSLNGVSSLSHVDLNNNNNMDLLVSVTAYDNLFCYKNDGKGNFTKETIVSTTPVQKYYRSIFSVDIDNDSNKDAISTAFNSKEIAWHKNTNGTFETPIIIDSHMQAYYASGVDMDDDGDKDILTASATEIIWYENKQNGTTFIKHILVSGLVNMERRAFAADMDNDGYMDIVSGDALGNLIVYENHTPDTTTPLPKTGDIDDGDFGGDYSFTRDSSTEIVLDALTGLMWQDDSAVNNNSKTWENLNLSTDCQINLGGLSGWRFPNSYELFYLAQKNSTVLDSTFENIGTSAGFISGKDYWTSSPKKVYVDFDDAQSRTAHGSNYIRCVRGKPIAFHLIRDDNKKVVLDKYHGLMWEDGEDSTKRVASSWDDAKSTCEGLDYLGFSAWRLPNINELYAIFNDNGQNNAFKYKSTQSRLISSTSNQATNDKAHGIDTSTGLDDRILDKGSSCDYRCVSDMVK